MSGLSVQFGRVRAVTDAGFCVRPGEFLGIVGESGSGKSVTARAVLGLLPSHARVSGSITFRGEELVGAGARRLRALRGGEIGLVFQDALAALDPVYTVGDQLVEALLAHRPMSRARARERAAELLNEVRIPRPRECLDRYPHQLSGGQRQRVVIATALIADPDLIIADEPTTALDVTVQGEVLDLLSSICEQRAAAVVLITHDLAVVAETCDQVAVFYGGIVAEAGPALPLFDEPRHPYTRALLRALPRLGDPTPFEAIPGTPLQVVGRLDSCPFAPRCVRAADDCLDGVPAERVLDERRHRCLHSLEASP
ncbi:ABC transporter ATP-binding protein [Streptomyces sp. WMMB 322]|uniref:ABC transporter ATP-binding protein n=1 Tax=Streptomyces sp. WMMB 322 TaxID=1286821 RepID=UPI00094393D5|nr:ABC transporter ATP-binding protein [Streptomyces sp. WMMB 322]